ncbi:immunoglobulin-like domain-containing protein [uncultured Aquimarina sp.]|uniref:immunoglobulin-like domain-containing protein n=1 Tax=uncultured Aquimarina sp. TaxID=575652 RepID=UPI002604AC54|nr:immunoglobulin-like domain-containing protein [uncultured Aquimarina sp.]
MKKLLFSLATILITVYGSYAQCGPGEDTTAPVFGNAGDGTMANPFKNLLLSTVGGVPSGTYYFNFNGSTFQGALDNDTDGGGWLMVLNYVHLAGDNSALQVRNTDLPLLGSSTVGDNEAGTANWGHLGNDLAAAIDFEEMRFYGETTGHTRIINFKTSYTNALNYLKTGVGNFIGINSVANFTALSGHTANLPGQTANYFTNQGDNALTEFPFFRSAQFHWGIRGGGATGNRWEVDDSAINTQSTIHRVWVRGDLSPSATPTLSATLDNTGNISISPTDFGFTLTDNCSTEANINLSLSQTDFSCADVGDNTIQFTATDEQNNNVTIDVTVTIVESPPVINTAPPAPFLIVALDSNGELILDLATLNTTVTDDCGIMSTTISRTDFNCDDIGFNSVTITTTDVNGNVTNASMPFIITDPVPPVIQCVASFSVELDGTGSVTLNPNSLLESFIDNCNGLGNVTLDKSVFTCADIGDNLVTLTVSDQGGNETTCTTTVTVTIPSCPGNLTLQAETDACGITYNYPCASNVTSGPPSGTFLAVGTTNTFTYDTLDNMGATVPCSYDVTVVDTEGPAFITRDQTLVLDVTGTVSLTANDLLGSNPLAPDYTVDQTGTFNREDISTTGTEILLEDDQVSTALPIGFEFAFYGNLYNDFYISSNGFITFTANSDDGCCDGQVLPDTTEPNNLIAFDWEDYDPESGGNIRYETIGTAPNRILIMDFDNVAHIDDAMQGTTTQVKLFETTNTIEIHATSISDLGYDKTQGLENINGTAAIIVPGRNAAQWSTTNDVVTFIPIAGIIDGCGVDTLVASQTDFDCTNLGTNIVTLTATDLNGNVSMQNAIVTVTTTDTTAPVITLTGDDPQEIVQGTAYSELGATADDGSMVVINASLVDINTVGSYSVTYNAKDLSCNDAIEVVRTINVVDTTAPVISLTGVNPQIIELGAGYTELGATTDDGSMIVIDDSLVDTNTVGSYSVRYNATDTSGNNAIEVIRTVNVVDTTAPVISLIGANPQEIELGAGYTELGATTDDGSTVVIDDSLVDTNTVGSYSVRYNAADASGNNTVEVIRTVTVVDTTAPVISLNGANPQVIELGTGYTELGATTDDGSTVVIDDSLVDTNTVGSYSARYNASDVSGNNAVEVIRTVNVVDTTAPVISLTGLNPQVIELGTGYTELGATTDDGSTVVIDDSLVDTNTVGIYSVRYNATDASGNNAIEVIRTVNVVDTTAPVISLIGANPQEIELGAGYTEWGATTDDGSMVVIDDSSVDTNTVGSYSVRYNATDASGNNAIEVIRTVNVIPLLTIEDNLFSKAVIVYPNPTSSILYIESSENLMDTIEVMDMSGRIIKRIEQDAVSRYQMNTSHLAGGIYFVKITSGNKEAIKRITKN